MTAYDHLTAADLHCVRVLIQRDHPCKSIRDAATADVAELAEWRLTHDRWPVFTWNGDRTEKILAIRLHAYAVRLAAEEGVPPPKNPLIAARSSENKVCFLKNLRSKPGMVRMRKETEPTLIEPWDVSQDEYPDGVA